MRILFVHNHYQQPGGEDRAVELESSLLIEKGHDVRVLYFDNKGIAGTYIQKMVAFKNAVYNSGSAAVLRHNILDFKPDLIHFHNIFFVASPSVLKEAYRRDMPVVVTLHNYRTICSNALLLRENKPCEICVQKKLPLAGIRYACYRKSSLASAMVTLSTGLPKLGSKWSKWVDSYIVLTSFAKEKFEHSSLGVKSQQFLIKPNFVPDPGIGDSKREPYFLYVGRISEEKGLNVLLEAFAEMADKKIRVVGDGPEKEQLMSKYKNCINIDFLGNRIQSEVIILMKKSMALIFPSLWYEGLPFVILEAFSTGTPIIASNLGAMASLIEDGYNGLLFRTGVVKELKTAILRFEANGEKMYGYARNTYLNNFHPEIHYQAVMKIYDQSIRESKRRRS